MEDRDDSLFYLPDDLAAKLESIGVQYLVTLVDMYTKRGCSPVHVPITLGRLLTQAFGLVIPVWYTEEAEVFQYPVEFDLWWSMACTQEALGDCNATCK